MISGFIIIFLPSFSLLLKIEEAKKSDIFRCFFKPASYALKPEAMVEVIIGDCLEASSFLWTSNHEYWRTKIFLFSHNFWRSSNLKVSLKVIKFRKQIDLFSFEPETGRNISFGFWFKSVDTRILKNSLLLHNCIFTRTRTELQNLVSYLNHWLIYTRKKEVATRFFIQQELEKLELITTVLVSKMQ